MNDCKNRECSETFPDNPDRWCWHCLRERFEDYRKKVMVLASSGETLSRKVRALTRARDAWRDECGHYEGHSLFCVKRSVDLLTPPEDRKCTCPFRFDEAVGDADKRLSATVCEVCEGKGVDSEEETCTICNGKGAVLCYEPV